MKHEIINIINYGFLGFKKCLTPLILMVMSLSVGISVAQAQNDLQLPELEVKRCEAKYPERFRQILEMEKGVADSREKIFKLKLEIDVKRHQADRYEELAKVADKSAEVETKKGNKVNAGKAENDAIKHRKDEATLRFEADKAMEEVERLNRSIEISEVIIKQRRQEVYKDCGINQGNNVNIESPIATPTGGNQSGNNQSNGGNNSNKGGSENTVGTIPSLKDPIRIDLPNDVHKLLYKNEFEQVVKQEVYQKKQLVGRYEVTKFHPNGQPAEDKSISYGFPTLDKHKEIHRSVKYDQNGNPIETKENTDFWDKTNQVKTTTWGGSALPIRDELITKDKNGKVKKEVYQDFGGKYGANTKIVTENGETTTYTRDENGEWKLKENKPAANNQASNKPPTNTPNKPPKAEDKPNQIGLGCLAGTWNSKEYKPESGKTGGTGITLTIKANGDVTVEYNNAKTNDIDFFTKTVVQIAERNGKGAGFIKVENNMMTIVREGPANIVSNITQVKANGERYPPRTSTIKTGLGPVIDTFEKTAQFTCSENELTLSTRYTFVKAP